MPAPLFAVLGTVQFYRGKAFVVRAGRNGPFCAGKKWPIPPGSNNMKKDTRGGIHNE